MDPEASLRVGRNGPLLLQDFHLIDLLAHFDRERIPERVVHAKGAGAYGEFEVTDDISDIVSFNRCPSRPVHATNDTAGFLDSHRHAQGSWQEDQHVPSFLDRGRRKGLR